MSCAASGLASAAEARAIAASRPGSASSPPTSSASRAAVSSASGITTAAPARSMKRALAVWWSAVAYGYGIRTAGRPWAAISKIDPPERATTRSLASSASPKSEM